MDSWRNTTAGRRWRLSFTACVTTTVLLIWPDTSRSQELVPADAQAIAREAYIYGFPVVENYKRMYASAIDADGDEFNAPFNTLYHRTQVFTPGDTSVDTPNIDTPYSFLWMDLRSEPLVLGGPELSNERYYSIQLIDLYHYTFGHIGSRTTGNGAGHYLVAGPSWTGEAPPNVAKVIRSETAFALAIYRTQLLNPDDVEDLKDIQKQYTIQTLSEFLGQPKPEPAIAVEFPSPEPNAGSGLPFFSALNFLLPFCSSPLSEDQRKTRFARIGVKAGEPFHPQELGPEIQAALRNGLPEGDAAITAAQESLKVREVIGTREFLGEDYLKRAVAAKLGQFGQAKEEGLYTLYRTDGKGDPLDAGQANYSLTLRPGDLPPVNGFWSLTMYDGQSQSLVKNAIERYEISSNTLPTMATDADGGLTLHIQQAPPGADQMANWLPAPQGPFYMVMRLYSPKPSAYDGTWTPPLVWRAESGPTSTDPKPTGAEAAEEVKPSVLIEEPKPELERPTVWGEPTEVQILIYIIDVDEVNSADQSFAASVYFAASWNNPFLRHQGPGPLHRNLTDVWNPRLTIVSQQMQWKSYPESVEIQPDGTAVYRQKVWGRFSQPLKLQDFPFDEQELSIQLVAAGLSEKDIKMVPMVLEAGRKSGIAKTFSLPDFDVESWSSDPQPYYVAEGEVGVAGYELKIKVARQPTYYILKVIIPLCLIVIMSWLPRWIDPEQTGTNIGISTSAFLTLVAYLFAITVLLPRVSYVTRMDRFILLSTLMVFAGLIHTVADTFLIKKDKKHAVEILDRWSRIVYPALLVIVLMLSFVL